jgi:hypothetical protein
MRSSLLALLTAASLSACGTAGPAVLQFVEVTPAAPRIGEVATVRFVLLDSRGLPLAGESVDFKLLDAREGITLSPATTTSLKGSGYAETQLIVSSRVNSVVVVATAGDKQVASPSISFAGTVPNGRQLTFQCGAIAGEASGGVHAIGAWDETRHLIAGVKLKCTAHTGDRNGDGVPQAIVSFLTEAGTIGPTETTVTDVVGNATILYKTSEPFPIDVAPGKFSWAPQRDETNYLGTYLAPLWMHPFEWVADPFAAVRPATLGGAPRYPESRSNTLDEPRRLDPIRKHPSGERYQNNSRDNLVTMIAVTSGEEGFTDLNNNGTWDDKEPFEDLPEPFVDSNDDGTRNEENARVQEERYIDLNGNGRWDGKNEVWDANTLIWVAERILWTGVPAAEDAQEVVKDGPVTVSVQPSYGPVTGMSYDLRCPEALPAGQPCYQAGPIANVVTFLSDPWFNGIARNSAGDGCRLSLSGKAPVELKDAPLTGFALTYPAGEILHFAVGDARDPNANLENQVPKRAYPILWQVPLSCQFTSSPEQGHVTFVGVGSVSGTID